MEGVCIILTRPRLLDLAPLTGMPHVRPPVTRPEMTAHLVFTARTSEVTEALEQLNTGSGNTVDEDDNIPDA